jgi:hypothetical protein
MLKFWRKHHLALLLLAYVVLAVAYSVIVPAGEGVDEIPHFAYVRYVKEGNGLPVQSYEPKRSAVFMGHHPPVYYLLGGLVTGWTDTSDFSQAFVPNPHFVWRENYGGNGWNVYLHFGQDDFPYRGAVLSLHVMRLLSVIMGAITVWAVYQVGRRVTGRADLSIAAAALTAFNPSFLFMTATVHHDSLMAMIGALSLLWMIAALQRPPSWKGYVLAGLLLAAGLLTKLSGLSLIALFGMVLIWIGWQQHSWRNMLRAGLIVYGLAAVLAGWWYVRNQILYGDPLAWNLFLSSQQHMVRTGPYGLTEFADFVGQLQRTFWGAFGYMHITLPAWTYNFFWIIAGVASVGLVVGIVRQRRQVSVRKASTMTWLVLLAALALWFISFVRFSIATVGAGHARYMFPVLAAISVMIVVGLSQLVPRRWSGIPAGVLSSVMLVYAVVCPVAVIPPLYPAVRIAQSAELAKVTPVDIDFGDSLRLIGYQIDRATAQAGSDVQLNLYWQASGTKRLDLLAEVLLVDAQNNLIGRSRQWVGNNGASIQVWNPNQVYVDSRMLRVADAAVPGDAQLMITTKQGREGPSVAASRAGDLLGDRVVLSTLSIVAARVTP